MTQSMPSCPQQQELIEKVQDHLIRLAELAHETSDALANRDYAQMEELDRETEHELGQKERAMGALREHRIEHGC